MIRQARELRARGEHPECTKMRFCLFGCMHGKRTCQLTPPTSPRVQVSKFKQAYEERKKVLQLGEQNSLLMRPPVAVPWPMQFAYTLRRRLGRVRLAPFSPSETSPRCVLTPGNDCHYHMLDPHHGPTICTGGP